MAKKIVYKCAKCGGTNIQFRAWVAPNENDKFCSYIDDEDAWCDNCEDHVMVDEEEVDVE